MYRNKKNSVVLLSLSALFFTAVLGYSAYSYGLFFEMNFYRLEWMIILLALLTTMFRMIVLWKNGNKASTGVMEVIYPAAGLLAIAGLYALSLLNNPVSVQSTIEQGIRWSTYAAFLWITTIGFNSVRGRQWLSVAVQAAGVFVVWGALAGWMGWISFPDIVMTTGDARLSAVGARLSGFVQYPNFLGAITGAYLLWSWLLLVRSRSQLSFFFVSLQLLPIMLAFLLTESRGAWLVTALGWLLGLLLVSRLERIKWLLYSGWTMLSAGAAYRFVVHIGARGGAGTAESGEQINEALLLIGALVITVAGFAWIRLWLAKGAESHRIVYFAWGGWIAVLTIMSLLLPSVIHGRLSGHFQTVGARKLFYIDAFKLIKQAPFLGHGGDTWRMMFTQIQSQPYVGSEVHSGYLELMLDLGVIGLLLVIGVSAVLIYRVWCYDRLGLLPIMVLLVHAAIDFDMSFGYYWLLLISWFVLYGGTKVNSNQMVGADETVQAKDAARLTVIKERLNGLGQRYQIVRAVLMVTAVLFLITAAIYSWRFENSLQYRQTAAASSGIARISGLRAALDWNPYWTRVRIELSKLEPLQERVNLLAIGLRYEPQSVPLLWALGITEAKRNNTMQAAAYMRTALHYDRFDRVKQTGAVVTMTQLAQQLLTADELPAASQAAEQAIQFFDAYASLGQGVRVNGRRFAITNEAKTAVKESRLINKFRG